MSDDDLGGFGSPLIQPKARGTRSQTNKVAGPSSKPSSSKAKPKPAEVDHEIIHVDGDEDEAEELGSRSTAGRRKQDNKPKSTNKGKAKASNQKSNPKVNQDEGEMFGESEMETEFGTGKAALRRHCEQLEKRLQREMKKREEAKQMCEHLTRQLDGIIRARETEAEALMIAQKEQYEAKITALERLNKELTSTLAKSSSLPPSGSSFLLTREAADEEKRQFEKEALQWQQQFEKAQAIIQEKEQREKELNFELDDQRKTIQNLKAKQPGPARPFRAGGGDLLGPDNPKQLQVIRFYEDFTNLLLIKLKAEPGQYLNLEDWIVSCIFTYISENDGETKHSLHFNLTCRWEKRDDDGEEVTSKDDLQEMMYYEPLELDKESERFVASLQTMGTAFSFTRDQLALFLRTLYHTFDEIFNDGQDEGQDGGVEEIAE